MSRRAFFVALALVVGATAGCSNDDGDALSSERIGTIEWRVCGGIQCGTLAVPLDRAKPDGEQITLELARLPASKRRVGVLFANPGGPGAPGVEFLRGVKSLLPGRITDAFDIVSWDPRGVGGSSPVQCLDDLDEFYALDRSPDTPAEVGENVDVTQSFVDACRRRSGRLLPFVSTTETVRDLDAIRRALGEEQISYLGFSYGSYLGTRYAELFPERVRAMVLDGAVDPTLPPTEAAIQQAEGFGRNLDAFLEYCRTDGCGFARSDPAGSFERLRQAIDAEPVYAEVDGEQRTLGPGEFEIAIVSALYYGRAGWDSLGAALNRAAQGLGDELLRFTDNYTQRSEKGHYANLTAALYAVGCADGPAPRTVDEVQRFAGDAVDRAPHFGATSAWLGLACTFWPVHGPAETDPIDVEGAPPIVVVSTTNDPATPYAWGESLVRQLPSSRLITVEGDTHTSLARGIDCLDDAVTAYLMNLELPNEGLRCG